MPHGSAKSSTGGTKPGEREPIDFLATGFKVTTNCAFSVKILENFKLRSDKLAGGCAHAPLSVHPPPLHTPFPPRWPLPGPPHLRVRAWRFPAGLRACAARGAWRSPRPHRRGRVRRFADGRGRPAEIKADEKGIEDFEGEMLRLKQRKEFLENRIVENKAWAANYDEHFGPFVNKYKEFMTQVRVLVPFPPYHLPCQCQVTWRRV